MYDPLCALCKKASNINCGHCKTFSYCSKKCKTMFLSKHHNKTDCFFLGQKKEIIDKEKEKKLRENIRK